MASPHHSLTMVDPSITNPPRNPPARLFRPDRRPGRKKAGNKTGGWDFSSFLNVFWTMTSNNDTWVIVTFNAPNRDMWRKKSNPLMKIGILTKCLTMYNFKYIYIYIYTCTPLKTNLHILYCEIALQLCAMDVATNRARATLPWCRHWG